jgi:pseudouridine synthase
MSNDRTKKPQPEAISGIRLNVFLQENGVASRRKADELIASGAVKVNGKAVTQLGTRISREDKVHVHGKLVGNKTLPKVVYILNKPDMCLTTRFDAKMRRTIFDLAAVKALPPNVQAVGRLDYRSEGLLLLTNDGDLAYALTHPRFSVEKSYAVLVSDGVTIEDVEKLRAGVMLDDGLAKAVSVRMGSKERMGATRGQWIEIVVTEGRNRLIRRMAEAIGLKVVRLVRVGMGEILLPATLKPGFIIPVDAAGKEQLEQIKNDMLRSLGDKPPRARLDEETQAKRRMKRQLKLNDEEYALEASRRSAEAAEKRKQRSSTVQKPTEDDRPIPRVRKSRPDEDRPYPRAAKARPEDDRPVPRPRRDSSERSAGAPRARRESSERSADAPRPRRESSGRSAHASDARARDSRSAQRPARASDSRSAQRPARASDSRTERRPSSEGGPRPKSQDKRNPPMRRKARSPARGK